MNPSKASGQHRSGVRFRNSQRTVRSSRRERCGHRNGLGVNVIKLRRASIINRISEYGVYTWWSLYRHRISLTRVVNRDGKRDATSAEPAAAPQHAVCIRKRFALDIVIVCDLCDCVCIVIAVFFAVRSLANVIRTRKA
ncbi:hypothetical protein U1Q18_046843 [Sarracenia purpurea var. burkii]